MRDLAPGFEAPPARLVEDGRQRLGRFAGPPVTLTLALPPELGDAQPLLAELRAQVAAVEAAVAAERMQTGARILGRRAILRQPWRSCPASRAPRRTLRPRLAAQSQ